jgi:SAM-dependent methyltransferase
MSHRFLNECLCCGSSNLRRVIDLGEQPPANSYAEQEHIEIPRFPLGLNLCHSCWHSQLTFCVDRREIFDNYAYVSGTSVTLNSFFSWFGERLARCYPPKAKVLELAANDGSLVKQLMRNHFDVIGIDPAHNIVNLAQERSLPIQCGYWPDVAEEIEGKFDIIICMNVVAHVDNPRNFVAACAPRLNPGGVLIVQPSQARMFKNGEFDTIYHEHISFFNINSMRVLSESVGLRLYGEALVSVHGDSPAFFIGLPDSPPPMDQILASFGEGDFSIHESLSHYEAEANVYDLQTYVQFEEKAQQIIHDFVKTVEDYRSRSYDIVFVGAAAKALTVINACGLRPDHFLDEAPMKIGKFAPGVGSRIEGLNAVRELTRPTLFVLTAWNFRRELTKKIVDLGCPAGSVFFSYFPKTEVFLAES